MPAADVTVTANFTSSGTQTGDIYELVSDVSTLSAGDKLVLLTGTSGSVYALSTTINTNNIDATSVTIGSDGKYIHSSNSVEVYN